MTTCFTDRLIVTDVTEAAASCVSRSSFTRYVSSEKLLFCSVFLHNSVNTHEEEKDEEENSQYEKLTPSLAGSLGSRITAVPTAVLHFSLLRDTNSSLYSAHMRETPAQQKYITRW